MKKLSILTLIILLAGAYAQASSNLYYGALRAESAPAAGGRVYAGIENRTDTLAQAMTSANQSTETMDGEVVFYAYAQASSGWSFAGWSNRPDGAVTRTENPLAVSVACRAKNENAPTTDTVYALFRELQSVMLTLETPQLIGGESGGGSYTAQFSDGTNITVTQIQTHTHSQNRGTVTLIAHADAGIKFFGWELSVNGQWSTVNSQRTYISYSDTLRDYGFTQDCTIRAVFVSEDTPLWEIKGQFGRYASLGEAIDGLRSTVNGQQNAVVALVSSGTLHGSYEIPEGVTMLIPFDKQLSCYREAPLSIHREDSTWLDETEFVRLTLAPGAELTVRGEVSLSAKMRAGAGGRIWGCGNVDAAYGRIEMEQGATMVLLDTAKLYCWGFITGQGEIRVQGSSRVYEAFHFPKSRGGNAINTLAGSKKHVFPVNQYYIQNIEAPLSLESEATLYVHTSLEIDHTVYSASAPYIGRTGLYRPAEGTIISKRYDSALDRQIYDISGDASLAELELNIGGYLINSEVYVLPITNNMDIRIHSGETTVEHQLALLADASITIDQDAALRFTDSTFVYDKDEWLLDMFNFDDYIHPAYYSPTRQFVRDTANMRDAMLDVNGTLLVDSAFYTTKSGANICSSLGTGRIIFNHVSPAADTTWQALQDDIHISMKAIPCTAPKLRNAERYAGTAAEYLPTLGISPGDTIFAHPGHWAWLRSWEDERSGQQSMVNSQQEGGTTVYAAVCALREEDLPELTYDVIPERSISTGEACVFLGWTDAERDEANQQITVWAQWDCPEEPVDAIDEVDSQQSPVKKIWREGEIIIQTPYHEYNILGVRVR